jgi:TrmH family RNA methyltransferase
MERLGRHSARLKELRRRVRERARGEVIVDGRRLVEDLVRWRLSIRELYLAEGVEVDAATTSAAAGCWELASSVFADIAPTRNPQGVLAVVDEPREPTRPVGGKVVVFLDGVQDPGNLGAVIRCVAGIGGDAVVLSPGCADPYHWAALRASAGAALRVPVARQMSAEEIASEIGAAGGGVWAAGTQGDPIAEWRPTRPTLLLLGAEGAGLSEETLALADGVVCIPLDRGIDSLNVAVAAGVLLHHLRSLG